MASWDDFDTLSVRATDHHRRDCFEEFASELDTPRADGLADFEPEFWTDEADVAVASSAVAEQSATRSAPAEEWSRIRVYPDVTSPSRADEGVKPSGTMRWRHRVSSLVVAAGVGAVTAAGFAGYLPPPKTPARVVQPAPPTGNAQNDLRTPPSPLTGVATDAVPNDPVTHGGERSSTIASDETNRQAKTRAGEAPPAVQRDQESEITSSEPRDGSGSAEGTAGSTASRGIASRAYGIAAKTLQTEPARRDPAGELPSEALTGWWTLTNEVHATSYRRYRGLRLVYRLRLQQDGNRVNGHGEKWAENDRLIPRAGRTPIELSGTIERRRLVLTFTERGLRRTSGGAFELTVIDNGRLSGTFHSDAAQSTGSSVAQRGDEPQEGQL